MFELSVALKYLLPKRRQLSASIISLISIIVISLVIWLILVFFSITRGLEKGWVEKLITITAPIRMTPTEKYYTSYYYQIDQHSAASDYSLRSIGEKKETPFVNPFNEEEDGELPNDFPKNDGKDLVKLAFEAIHASGALAANDYEVTSANMRLRLLRNLDIPGGATQSFLSQPIYIGTFDGENPAYDNILSPFSQKDLENVEALNVYEGPTKTYTKEGKGYQIPEEGIIAPKSFRDAGVLLGDRGYVSYYAPTASSLQEQRLPVYITGFYDPGIVPLGGKFLLANPLLVRTIRTSQAQESTPLTNGINIRLKDVKDTEVIKRNLIEELEKRGIGTYWKVETYREFDYAKDLLQQLSSEKNIFSLISAVIIIVACSNIISMLIILVKDKRLEIGILRSMGASSGSIALIFGFCGIVMGMMGTLIGTLLAYLTLKNLNSLLAFISKLQGFEAFNPVFYGDHLPNSMSYETLVIILFATGLISLLAGIIPALKASRMKPSAILRSE